MQSMYSLLVVDDDLEIRTLLREFLLPHGFEVFLASDGIEMSEMLEKQAIDLIILDVMLPGEDGLSLCRKLRLQSNTPILMLTAIGEEVDRIIGLEMGADDYLQKPFHPRELLARIKAILRRVKIGESRPTIVENTIYRFSGWMLNRGTRQLFSPDQTEITLSSSEFALLLLFLENPYQILTRDKILAATKNRSSNPFDRSLDIQISRLRNKIEEDAKNPLIIKTVRGRGYALSVPVT